MIAQLVHLIWSLGHLAGQVAGGGNMLPQEPALQASGLLQLILQIRHPGSVRQQYQGETG